MRAANRKVNIDDLDASLTMLGGMVASQAGILLELEHHPARMILGPDVVTGASRRHVDGILGRLADAWAAFSALQEVMATARGLRGRRSRADARAFAELETLLHGPSVAALLPPAAPAPAAAARAAAARIRPGELARRLDHALGLVQRDLGDCLDRHQAGQAAAAAARNSLAATEREARRLRLDPGDAGLVLARRLVGELSDGVRRDPFGLPADLAARAEAAAAAAWESVADLARRHDHLFDDLAQAADLLARIIRLDEAGRGDARRAASRIGDPGPLVCLAAGWLDDPHRGLRPWLNRLRRQAGAGRWKEASRGLTRWFEVADATRRRATHLADANGAGLRRRDELRGLLGAWEAKARRLGVAGSPALAALAAQAHSSLSVAPVDLVVAARRVDAYGAALAGLGRPGTRSPPSHGRSPATGPAVATRADNAPCKALGAPRKALGGTHPGRPGRSGEAP